MSGSSARAVAGLLVAAALGGCATVALQLYDGPPRPAADVSTVRLWGPGVIVQKVDGKDAGVKGTESHAYLLPGEHTFEVKLVRIRGYHLLCGILCDAIFNKPKVVTGRTEAGHSYTFRFVNDEAGSVAFEDKGANYDPVCLDPRNYRDGKNC